MTPPLIDREEAALEPCPFCGGEKLTPFYSMFLAQQVWAVFCDTCQTEGPHHLTEAEAIAAWNTRALPPCRDADLREALQRQTDVVERLCWAIERAEQDIGGESIATVLKELGPANDAARATLGGDHAE